MIKEIRVLGIFSKNFYKIYYTILNQNQLKIDINFWSVYFFNI